MSSGSGVSYSGQHDDIEKKADELVSSRFGKRAAPAAHLVGDMQINSSVQALAYVSLKVIAKGVTVYEKVRLAIERKEDLEYKSYFEELSDDEKEELDSGLFRIDVSIRQRIPEDGGVYMFAELMNELAYTAGDFSPSIKGKGRGQVFDVLRSQKTLLSPEEKQPGRIGRFFGRGNKQE